MITIKSDKEIKLMREACKLTASVYDYIGQIIKPGMSTWELDKLAEEFMRKHGGIPAEKGYPSGVRGVPDFPGSLCVSINDIVIHGVPSKDVIIKDGDVVKIDTVVLKNGYNGDAARTYLIGNVSSEAKKIAAVAKQAFYEGLKFAKEGNRVGDISHAIETYVRSQGFNLVREFQGHGIGKEMHEDPGVPNIGKAGKGPRLQAGMTICIEPMIMAGKEDIWELEDGWSIATQDGSLTAHYENTVLITKNEPEVLTIL